MARDIMNRYDPVNIPARRQAYKEGGWSRYDPNAPGYTKDEVRAERERYRR
jgi:hypothetical protein